MVEAAAASTRDVPLRRRCTQATGKQRLGQPFSQARCRAMAFAHQRRQLAGRRAAFRTGRRPQTGAPAGYFCNKPKRCRLRKRKIGFFSPDAWMRRQRPPHCQTRMFLDESVRARIDDGVSLAANRGERITTVLIRARWREQAAQDSGCDCVRCSPEQLRHTLKQSSSRALPCTAACERRRVRLHTKVARPRNDHISRGKTCSTSPSRTRASDATDPSA